MAPTVPSAIKDIKQKRAYGLNRQQELVVYRSKLESYLAYLESKTHEPSSVDAETINCVKEAVSRSDNLQKLVKSEISPRHLMLHQLLQQQQEAVLRAMN